MSAFSVGSRFAPTPSTGRRHELATHWDFEDTHRPACPKTRRTKRARLTRNQDHVTCRDCLAFLARISRLVKS